MALDRDEVLGGGELRRRILRVDEDLEELRHGVLAGGREALLAETLLAQGLRQHADRLGDALRVAGQRAAAGLDAVLDAGREVAHAAHGAAARHGAREAVRHLAAVDDLGEVGVGHRGAEHGLTRGLREVGLADEHVVDEVLEGLRHARHVLAVLGGGAAVLRQRGGRGREEGRRDEHRGQRETDAVDEGRLQGHRDLQMDQTADRMRGGQPGRTATRESGNVSVLCGTRQPLNALYSAPPRRSKRIFGAPPRIAAGERGKAVKFRRGRAAVTGGELGPTLARHPARRCPRP